MGNVIAGVRYKLNRALIRIDEIQACVDSYSHTHPHQMLPQSDGKAQFNVTAPEAIDVAVIAGEAIYQIRSALDNLAFALVQLNQVNGSLPAKWEEKCQFPIWRSLKPGQTTPLHYNAFESALPCISRSAFKFIESIQPYYGVGGVNNALRLLNILSNIDKHRHFATTKHRGQLSGTGRTWATSFALDHGTDVDFSKKEYPPDDPSVDVYWLLTHFVSFDEPELGNACAPSIQEIIQTILDHVQGTVVPMFEEFITQP